MTTQDRQFLIAYGLIWLFSLVVAFIIYLIKAFANYYLFKQAGEEGWKAFIPIYNSFIKHKIAFGEANQWFWFIGLILGVYNYYTYFAYARSYGRSVGYSVFALFFPWISDLVMAISKDRYYGPRQHVLQTL